MPLDTEQGKKMLQLLTSRYDDRHWRKEIERTLSLTPAGVGDDKQRAIFLYLKRKLKAYKSFRADPDAWIVGGFATQEVVLRAKTNPALVDPSFTKDDVAFLGADPGSEVDHDWWEEMLVWWFEGPEDEEEEKGESDGEAEGTSASEDSTKHEGTGK